MASCDFCKVDPNEELKSCVCKKASYCSKDCQAKDRKNHKSACPLYIIRDAPGKGKGWFATRKIKMGQIILEELPLLTMPGSKIMNFDEFKTKYYPNIDENTKVKILKLHDPLENLHVLGRNEINKLSKNNPNLLLVLEEPNEEASKILRIFNGNNINLFKVSNTKY